jgi:hypothetical protein
VTAEPLSPTSTLADAFATTFWVAVGLIALAVVPAVLLPRLRRPHEPGAATATDAGGSSPSAAPLDRHGASAPSRTRTQTTTKDIPGA